MEMVLSELRKIAPRIMGKEEQEIAQIMQRWEARWSSETMKKIIVRDIGIAFIIVVILTITIELYARNRLLAEMRGGVLEATFKKIIPPVIFEEVRSHIIGAKALRKSWDISISVYRDAQVSAMNADYYMTKTVTRYKTYNLVNYSHKQRFRSGLDLDISGSDASGPLPRYDRIQIGNDVYQGDGLRTFLNQDGISYNVERSLPASSDEFVEVINEVRDILRAPDTFPWLTTMLTDGAKVTIDSSSVQELKFEVKPLHPDRDRIMEVVTGRT